MTSTIVVEFMTLDGVVEDPDGAARTPTGGWAFRFGPEAVAGDKFRLGPRLDTGLLLLGRSTWEQFSRIWPGRTDEFSTRMNRADKLVASRSLSDVNAWENSALLAGDLSDEVRRLAGDRDVIVIGSLSLVHTLMRDDLVDEYRLLIFPTVLGSGRRLFDPDVPVGDLQLQSAERNGAAALLRYTRPTLDAG